MQDNFTVTEHTDAKGAKIVVIGVGGGGQNMVEELTKSDIADKVKLVAANADAQALKKSNAPHKIQLGPETTKGLGCGMKPEVGKAAAMESIEEIKKVLLD
jgi:cell division protein FtsZ